MPATAIRLGDPVPIRIWRGGVAEEVDPAALLAAAAAGDRGAIGSLYDALHRDVYRFLAAAAATRGPDLDDLVQETFIVALRSARKFSGRSTVKTWLFGIAFNLGRTHARAEARRRRAMARAAQLPRVQPIRPDQGAQANQQLEQLAAAIDALPYAQRAAYVLNVIEGVPAAAAARARGLRLGTLGRRVHDARRRLAPIVGRSDP
jgi:RNA polymerase sigma-70 factor (ECF subfamily)